MRLSIIVSAAFASLTLHRLAHAQAMTIENGKGFAAECN